MKKRTVFLILLVTSLCFLPGCNLVTDPAASPQPAPTNTAAVNALKRVTPTAIIEAPPTNTATPPTDEPTSLPESPEPTVPATATLSSEPIQPFTPGYIAFLHSTKLDVPVELFDLYFAIPGATPKDWQVAKVLSDLTARDMFPSPDHRQIVLPQFQDSDGNGFIAPKWGDFFDIDIFNVSDNSLKPLTEEQFDASAQISWQANSRYFAFPSYDDVFLVDTELSEVQLLGSYNLSQVSWSPDNKWLAGVGQPSMGLFLLNSQTDEIISVVPEQKIRDLFWSPDSQYLAYTGRIGAGLFVLNLNAMEIKTLVSPDHTSTYADWSNDGELLAFIDDRSSLHIWNPITNEVQNLIELSDFNIMEGPPKTAFQKVIWSPDNSGLAFFVYDDQQWIRLVVVDIQGNNFWEAFSLNRIPSSDRGDFADLPQFQLITWSLDGRWLLFYAEPNNQPGLYIVSYEGGEPHLIFKTSIYNFSHSNLRSDMVSWLNVIPRQQFPESTLTPTVAIPNMILEEMP